MIFNFVWACDNNTMEPNDIKNQEVQHLTLFMDKIEC